MKEKYLKPSIEVIAIEIENSILVDSYEGSSLDQIIPGVSMGDY